LQPKCAWIVSAPDACAECALNSDNRPQPSPWLTHLFYLEACQAAGIVFHYEDLTERETRGLVIVKGERNRQEMAKLNKK
jgi:hypothetical protein